MTVLECDLFTLGELETAEQFPSRRPRSRQDLLEAILGSRSFIGLRVRATGS